MDGQIYLLVILIAFSTQNKSYYDIRSEFGYVTSNILEDSLTSKIESECVKREGVKES